VGTQNIGNAAIEAFDHAVGLWGPGLDEAMLDTVILFSYDSFVEESRVVR